MSTAAVDVLTKVVLVSIDGWGISAEKKGNAIANAKTPYMTELEQKHLHVAIEASGHAVGLPRGVMGNSEVGHLTMGAGRVSWQDLVRINKSIEDGEFAKNPTLVEAFKKVAQSQTRLHLLGLVSDGNVHSSMEHLYALIQAAKEAGVPHTFIHVFADGRDTAPTSAVKYIQQVQDFLNKEKYGSIATIQGRYYGMDRDKRWERIKIGYDLLVGGVGEEVKSEGLLDLINKRYEQQENDEFLKPIVVNKEGIIKSGDSLIFFNFRSDRMREITSTFAKPSEKKFDSSIPDVDVTIYQMTQYDEKLPLPTLFPPQVMTNGLAEWISKHHLKQLHTAETEKFAHVTFFFAGGRELQFEHEDRVMIPSPKVPTYDKQPEMSMREVGDSVIEGMKKDYPFILCNLAAPDMVGHTGVYDAAVVACTTCDEVIGKILQATREHGYTLVVTADHGNAEEMLESDGSIKTSHTTNLIPLSIALAPKSPVKFELARDKGGLSDVAPTVLTLMGLPIPTEMSGSSVLKRVQ